MVVFTVFIDGGLESIHKFEVEEATKGIIKVTLPYSTAVAIDDSFEIKTDGTTWIKGKVQRIKTRRIGMTDTKVITCYGKTHTLYEKHCIDFGFHQYFNKDVGWIVNDLVDHYFNAILTSVNVNVATGVNVTSFECDGRSVGEALEDLAGRGDCNFYVDNDDDVHFFIRPGAASGLTAEDLGELKITDESGRKFVKVIVRGRHRAIQASAGANYPEFFYQDDRIISTAEAGEVAAAMVAELGAARQQVVAREDSFMETRAGKTIILNVPADGFNDQVIEIQKIRWVCKQPNLNQTYFTLGDKEPTIDSVLARLARGVTWLPDVQVQRGAAFPTDPFDDQAFMLTGDVVVPADYYGAAEGILYTWDATNSVWKRAPANLGLRGEPPAGGEVTGDTYVSNVDGITYQWSGAAWVQVAQPTLADATDFGTVEWPASSLKKGIQKFDSNVLVEAIQVLATAAAALAIDVNDGTGKAEITGAGVPFADFTAGDKIVIQHCEDRTQDTVARTVQAVNGGGASITLDNVLVGADNADDETMQVIVSDGLKWTGDTPAVWFADGTTQNIANGAVQGLAAGNYWVIFTVAAGVTVINNYANAVGDTVGIIGRVHINFNRGAFIFPVFMRGGSMTLDYLGAGIIDTLMLTGDALIGKILKTSEGVDWTNGVGDPGVIITREGIKGKGAAGALQTLMDINGTIVAGADVVTLASNGITIKGQGMYFTDAADALRGWVWGLNPGNPYLQVAANAGDLLLTSGVGKYIELLVAGNSVKFNPAGNIVFADNFNAIVPTTTGNLDIGTIALKMGAIWGPVKYADLHMLDTHCPMCDNRFKIDEKLKFIVTAVEKLKDSTGEPYEQIRCIPVHANCLVSRIKRWLHRGYLALGGK